MSTVSVIGDGGWGTAISIVLSKNGHVVRLWSAFPEHAKTLAENMENVKFLPGISLPESIDVTDDVAKALDADTLVVAVPTKFMRVVLQRFAEKFSAGPDMVSVAKGIEHDTLKRPSEIISELLPGSPIGVLSGPSHAEEVARLLPTAVVAASEDQETAERIQSIFANEFFRVYTSTDMRGVELGGAFKNVIAIAAGICDGLTLGDNAKSALITRGLEEMRRLGVAMGAERSTFFGLSGIGDLVTTCVSPYGRNRQVGRKLGMGEKLDDILAQTQTVAEGILTAKSVCLLADKYGVDVPISRQVYAVAFEGRDAGEAVRELMARAPRVEFE